jgi:hypothetical protein
MALFSEDIEFLSRMIPVHMVGQTGKCQCPYCPEEPQSVYLNADRGTWHCLSCGAANELTELVAIVSMITRQR